MKMKIISIFIMLALMAILPFAAAKCGKSIDTTTAMSTADNAEKENEQTDEDKVLCGLTAALYKSEYTDETVKAIAVLLNTDYSVSPEKFDLSDSSVCIYIENADNSLKESYSHIEEIVNSAKEIFILFDGEKLFVPYSIISNGNTVYNETYDYIIPVASPWDCFSEIYDKNADCSGVSIEGLNYLCKNGMTAEEALQWYLPNASKI